MKKLNILLLALFAFSLFGCEDDDKVTMKTEITPPTLDELLPENLVITENTNLQDKIAYWHWAEGDYGFPAAVTYTVEADTSATFTQSTEIGTSTTTSLVVTAEMLNKAALKYTKEAEPITLFIRLKAILSQYEFPSVVEPVYSNIQTITLTPYTGMAIYPENLYMIGKDFGDWNWGNAGIVEMIPVNGKEGEFWCIQYFTAANGFKWSPVKDWNGDFFELTEKIGYTTADGNAFVPKDGLYMVYIDMPNGKIAIEEALVYGMGDCFGGWDEKKYPFTINGKTASITTSAAGELRMYAGSSIATSDWWTREFIILDGKIVYRGNGGDQDRVRVEAGKTVTLDFSAGTGTY